MDWVTLATKIKYKMMKNKKKMKNKKYEPLVIKFISILL